MGRGVLYCVALPAALAMIPGFATTDGTQRFRDRLGLRAAPGYFCQQSGLWFSSIGLGTYLGNSDDATDALYQAAIERAVQLGVNVIDSAINYRFQRAERSVGAALKELFDQGRTARDELIIATKGGFLTPDGEMPRDPSAYFLEEYIKPGILDPDEIAGGMHCMSPRYLANQLGRSQRNLGLQCIDIYYVHNPESQLDFVPRSEFLRRLKAAFEMLESAVAEGKIRMYGTATWDGYRQAETARNFLSLEEIVKAAREVAGDKHHFKVIQLPHNLAMIEAFLRKEQRVAGATRSLLEAAQELGISVIASASLLQGQVGSNLPEFIGQYLSGLDTDPQRAIQFVRSTPGITTALVGMSRIAHVEENLKLAGVPRAPVEDFMKLFSANR